MYSSKGLCRCFEVAGRREGGSMQSGSQRWMQCLVGTLDRRLARSSVQYVPSTVTRWASKWWCKNPSWMILRANTCIICLAWSLFFFELMGIFYFHSPLAPLFTVLCIVTLDDFLGLFLTHIIIIHLCIPVYGPLWQINNECIDLAVSLHENFCLGFILRGLMPMLIRHPASPGSLSTLLPGPPSSLQGSVMIAR